MANADFTGNCLLHHSNGNSPSFGMRMILGTKPFLSEPMTGHWRTLLSSTFSNIWSQWIEAVIWALPNLIQFQSEAAPSFPSPSKVLPLFQGPPFGHKDLPFSHQGLSFCHQGLPFGTQGLPFGTQGFHFSHQGLPFGHQGLPLVTNKSVTYGRTYVHTDRRTLYFLVLDR